jgi:hypothetical protein
MSENEGPQASNEEQSRGLHVVFGTGPVGLTVADELSRRGKRVRRTGTADARLRAEVSLGGG